MQRAAADLHFASFRLDVGNECLWRGEEVLKLTPKAFAILRYLLDHAGQLVTKEMLWQAIWQGTAVTDAALTMCLSEIRKALGDNAKTPQFIETVHRRGYRFIGTVASSQQAGVRSKNTESSRQESEARRFSFPPQSSALSSQHSVLVGRETELAHLQDCLAKAVNGERQLVFITGEPGIGKTALMEAFLARLGAGDWRLGARAQNESRIGNNTSPLSTPTPNILPLPPLLARGYCVESYGAGEAYLPVLTALEGLCRTSAREEVVTLLQQQAPMWLTQFPSLLSPEERESLQRQLAGATGQRMLREMANFLTALTARQPLVLVLEDLHWSDPSTVTLLSYLARRSEQRRLLVLGSYRPTEVAQQKHPLAAVQGELAGQGLCTEISLPFLSEVAVADYLQQRAPERGELSSFASTLYRQTAGHPLFMVATVDEWLTQEANPTENRDGQMSPSLILPDGQIPERLRQLVQVQIERMPRKERQVLEAASVAGFEFSAAEVAAALTTDEVLTEERCELLAGRRHFLRPAGVQEWPDGTIAARYGFRHAVYQSLWQERVKAGRWKRYHQLIGERKEVAYGDRANEIAAELALHFEQGRDYRRAVHYHQAVGDRAWRSSADLEAVSHISRGLTLLRRLPNTPERAQQELTLQVQLTVPVGEVKGDGSRESERAYRRAYDLCRQTGDKSYLFRIAFGLFRTPFARGKMREALVRAKEMLRVAQEVDAANLPIWGYDMLGLTLYFRGEFPRALSYLQKTLSLYDQEQYRAHMFETGQDPGTTALFYMSGVLWKLGYPYQALQRVEESLTLAREMSRPFSVVAATIWAGELHVLRGEILLAQERAEAAIAYATQRGLTEMFAAGTILRAWTLIEQGKVTEGQALLQRGGTVGKSTGSILGLPYFLSRSAQIAARQGRMEEGIQTLTKGLKVVQRSGERRHEAELYRLKGQLTLEAGGWRLETGYSSPQAPSPELQVPKEVAREAEACFHKAIAVAQRQQAKSWELRATTSLARLWQSQGKRQEALHVLSSIYNWFTEGYDTRDLQEAKALIEELSD